MHQWRVLVSICVLALSLIPVTGTSVKAQGDSVPRFEPGECLFDVGEGENVDCGYLIVLEDRSQPDGPTIRIPVAILHSWSDTPEPDPVVYLEGGPGGSTLELGADWLTFPARENRDVIIYDQRGTGFSEPSLNCPELDDLWIGSMDDDLTTEESIAADVETAAQCRDRLVSEGINLSAYTSKENAADLADMRVALGYDEWNLYGISYGTRLALTVMRDHPEGIRSVVLDSVYPPQVEGYEEFFVNGVRAFNQLFQGCAADSFCNKEYPDLENVVYALHDQLEANPVSVDTVNLISNEPVTVLLDGSTLVETMFNLMYVSEIIPDIPSLIYQVKNGDYTYYAMLTAFFDAQTVYISEGMYYSVECNEEAPFNDPAVLQTAATENPEFADFILSDSSLQICQTWGSGTADPVENEPVTSDIPTLVFSGEYDPITPPAWGQAAADNLSHSYFFQIPGMGHGVSYSPGCPQDVLLEFLDDPTVEPDSSCISGMTPPDFENGGLF